MSPHGRPKGPRLGLQAEPARQAVCGPQGPHTVHTRPLGGTARSAKGVK